MTPLDFVLGRLVLLRQLVPPATVQQLLANLGGRPLVAALIAGGLDPQVVQALAGEAAGAPLACSGCGQRLSLPQLDPAAPWRCRACGGAVDVVGAPSARGAPASPRLSVGQTVDGYELLAELGRGGMGVVFKARAANGTLVALKVLLQGGQATAAQQKRFLREAEALAKLDHPAIVRVVGVGGAGSHPYLALELVEGQALDELLARESISLTRAVTLTRDAARGLQHAHERGVIHRDVKPSNLLIQASDGAPRITDFGLVRDASLDRSRLTASGVMLGTLAYMPPEQVVGEGHRATAAADVYSLGATLFEMVTGERPFRAETQLQLAYLVSEQPPPRPSKLNPEVPPQLEALILQALAKDPDDRPAAEDLAEALDRFLEGGGPTGAPRRRLAGAVIAVVALAAAALAVAVASLEAEPEGERPLVASPPNGDEPDADDPTDDESDAEEDTQEPDTNPPQVDAAEAFEAAQAAYDAFDRAAAAPDEAYADTLRAAIEAADRALELQPDDSELRFQRGRAWARLVVPSRARADLQRVRDLDPNDELARRAGLLLVVLQLDDLSRNEDLLPTLEAWLKIASAKLPGPWLDLFRSVRAYATDHAKSGELVATCERVADALKDVPELPAVYAFALASDARIEPCVQALDAALKDDPQNASLLTLRARLLLTSGRPERGEADLTQALVLHPSHPTALELRGALAANRGDVAAAERDLRTVLEALPDRTWALSELTKLLQKADRHAEAIALLRRAEDADPTQGMVTIHLYEAHLAAAELDPALEALSRALIRIDAVPDDRNAIREAFSNLTRATERVEILRTTATAVREARPRDPLAAELLGLAALIEGSPERALSVWDEWLEEHPDHLELRAERLKLLQATGSREAYEAELKELVELGEKDMYILCHAAHYHAAQRKDFTRARALAEQATRAYPNSQLAWGTVAFIDLLRMNNVQAREAENTAIAFPYQGFSAARRLTLNEVALGRFGFALNSLEAALRSNPFDSSLVDAVGSMLTVPTVNANERVRRYVSLVQRQQGVLKRMGQKQALSSRMLLARGLFRLGEREASQAELEGILEEDPENAAARRALDGLRQGR